MKVAKIFVSNRTKNKAENLNKLFKNLEIVEWGFVPDFDVIINATAYTAVDKAEENQEMANLINHLAVKNIADICNQQEAAILF